MLFITYLVTNLPVFSTSQFPLRNNVAYRVPEKEHTNHNLVLSWVTKKCLESKKVSTARPRMNSESRITI